MITAIVCFALLVNAAFGQLCVGNGIYNANFEKCYHVFTAPQAYGDSTQICMSIGGQLTSIHNAFEQSLVFGNVLERSKKNDYWIGLNDIRQQGVWEWADGANSSYFNWASGFPKSNFSCRCVGSFIRNGLWYNADCTARKSFVCEVEPNYGFNGQSPYCGGDGLNFGKCFFYMNLLQSHSSAKQLCEDLGVSLVTIGSSVEQAYLQREIRTHQLSYPYWIGLEDPFDSGNWKWDDSADNSSSVFTNWDQGFPLNSVSMDCAVAELTNGKWYNLMCDDDENAFVCQTKPSTNGTAVSTTTTYVPPPTPHNYDGWVYYNVTGFWYKLMSYNTWEYLESLCQVEGGHLASIHSPQEDKFVRSLQNSFNFIFLGLKAPEDDNLDLTWTDGTKLDYTNWQLFTPGGPDYCVVMINTGEWTNLGCWLYYWGVCKKR